MVVMEACRCFSWVVVVVAEVRLQAAQSHRDRHAESVPNEMEPLLVDLVDWLARIPREGVAPMLLWLPVGET